jgi:hypothetical protein
VSLHGSQFCFVLTLLSCLRSSFRDFVAFRTFEKVPNVVFTNTRVVFMIFDELNVKAVSKLSFVRYASALPTLTHPAMVENLFDALVRPKQLAAEKTKDSSTGGGSGATPATPAAVAAQNFEWKLEFEPFDKFVRAYEVARDSCAFY